ncbi:MAG: hypothetical protein ABWX59_02815 [Microbacteriaceae bacterium]
MPSSTEQASLRFRNLPALRLPAPHRVLAVAGLILLLSAAVHGVVFLLSGTSWDGPVSFRKPVLFGFSFGITCVTIALIATQIRMRPWLAWLLLGPLAVASVVETVLITMQAWRGVPSHFNDATPFDRAVFDAMGSLVIVVATVIVVLTILSFTSITTTAPGMALSIRAGLVLLAVGQALGLMIIMQADRALSAGNTAAVLGPHGVLFGEAGILKSPHGVAMHALQVLPLLGLLVQATGWTPQRRVLAVWSAIAGYSLLLAVIATQAYTGQAPLALGTLSVLLALIAVLLITVPYAAVAWLLGRQLLGRSPTPSPRG